MKKYANTQEEKTYALLSFIVDTVNGAGHFIDSSGEEVHIGDHVYVVGGAVRNFVIGKPIKDIDMTIDSVALSTRRVKRDAEWLSNLLISKIPVGVSSSVDQYGVAKITIKDPNFVVGKVDLQGQEIEIATARKEYYELGDYKPYQVEATTIDEDIYRREFTFNTLLWNMSGNMKSFRGDGDENRGSYQLQPISRESIIDITGRGLSDLEDGVARVPRRDGESYSVNTGEFADEIGLDKIELDQGDGLGHIRQSYIHDASRIVRLIKFKFKYNFEISEEIEEILLGPSPIPGQDRFVEVLNFIPHNHLYNLLTQVIFVNKETLRPSLVEMQRLKMLDVIVNIFRSKKEFETAFSKWIYSNGPEHIFMFKDFGFPLDGIIGFLTSDEQERLKSVSAGMPMERSIRLLEALKKPNDLFKDRSFYPKLISNIPKKDLGIFRSRFMPIAKDLILSDLKYLDNPEDFKSAVMSAMSDDPAEDASSTITEDMDDSFDDTIVSTSSFIFYEIASLLTSVSNEMDKRGLMKESDFIDGVLHKYSKFRSFSSTKEYMIDKLFEAAKRMDTEHLIPDDVWEMDVPEIGLLFGVVKKDNGISNNLRQKRESLKSKLRELNLPTEEVDSMTELDIKNKAQSIKGNDVSYFAKSRSIISDLNLSGDEHIYVFDFDDTLMWTEEWHSSVSVDSEGHVTDPGNSRSVSRALELLPYGFALKKVFIDKPKKGRENQTVFRVIKIGEEEGSITLDNIKDVLPPKALGDSSVDIRGKYVDFPAVTADHEFYADPETAGKIGPNPDVFKEYINASSGIVMVLTARSDVPGMVDEIKRVIIESGGREPDHIFVKPGGSSGSEYKGRVIRQIAEELGPNGEITFFDDNPRYIEGVESAISENDGLAKVNIIKVDASKKPVTAMQNLYDLKKLANYMDYNGYYSCADSIDLIIKRSSEERYSESQLMGPIMAIIGLSKKLERSGKLVVSPPSKEDLLLEGMEHGPEHLRRWFQIMQGKDVVSPDYNRKKQLAKRVNDLFLEFNLSDYNIDRITDDDIDNMSIEEISQAKKDAEYTVGKINAMNSGGIIKLAIPNSLVYETIENWSPPEGFEMLKNDSFHVTIISPKTVANFKDIIPASDYNSLRSEIDSMLNDIIPSVSPGIGLAVRDSKKTFALAIQNQADFQSVRDKIVDKISAALEYNGLSPDESMEWWSERDNADVDRYFHISIANDGDGWPTNSVSDIREGDFEDFI